MPRLSIVLATAALAVGLAVVAVKVVDQPVAGAGDPEPPTPTATGRTPAFHLRLTPEQRLKVARQCLDSITSAQAKALGTVKDDLALLADDPKVVAMVLEDFAQRLAISRFEAAAFGDIFALVKNPDFAEAGLKLVDHEEFSVRHKIIAIAATQHDPRYVAGLDSLFADIVKRKPGEGMRTLELILHAARVCGGDHLPVLLARALRCEIPQIRDVAGAIIREDEMKRLAPRLEPLLEDEMPQARLQAAWGLASFGHPTAADVLLKEFDPREPAAASFVLEAVRDLDLKRAIPVIKEHLEDADPELRAGMLLTLAFLDDAATLADLKAWAYDDDASVPDRMVGLMGLAALGNAEDDVRLCEVVKNGGPHEAQNIAIGLSFREGTPDSALVRALIASDHFDHTAMLSAWLPRVDASIVPWLLQRLVASKEVNDRLFHIGCLGLIGTAEAREAILSRWKQDPRLVEERIRLLDLNARKGIQREG